MALAPYASAPALADRHAVDVIGPCLFGQNGQKSRAKLKAEQIAPESRQNRRLDRARTEFGRDPLDRLRPHAVR